MNFLTDPPAQDGPLGETKRNDFREDLKYSEEASGEDFWQEVYKEAFPDIVFAIPATEDTQGQKFGIDRVVYMKSGKTIYIDEKKRREVFGDILLEYKSNDNQKENNGWMNKELIIDYLAYAFMPTKTVYLLDWLSLRRAWLKNGIAWKKLAKLERKGFRIVKAKNRTYNTLSIAVPIKTLMQEISRPIIIELSS